MRPADLLLPLHGTDGRTEEADERLRRSKFYQISVPLRSRERSGWSEAREGLLSSASSQTSSRANRLCRAPWSKPTRAKRWLRNCSSCQDCWRERCETRTISVACKPGVRIRRKAQLQMRRNAYREKVRLYFPNDECPNPKKVVAYCCPLRNRAAQKYEGRRNSFG